MTIGPAIALSRLSVLTRQCELWRIKKEVIKMCIKGEIEQRMGVKPMLVVMRPGTTPEELDAILGMLAERGIEAHLVSAS